MNDGTQTPLKEAISIITIVAIIAAVGCYAGTVQKAPGLAPGVFWVASLVYEWCPALNALHGANFPVVIGSTAIGLAVFLFGVPIAPFLAVLFTRVQLQNIERSTVRLKRNRARFQKKERSKDDFIVH